MDKVFAKQSELLFMLGGCIMSEVETADIEVYDKDNKLLAPCTLKRACKLVKRNSAEWIADNQIKLLVNKDDRKKLRKEIEIESKRICYICGTKIPLETPITLDHVNPKSNGGSDEKGNIRCACKRCNDNKKNRTIKSYVRYISDHRFKYTYISDEQLWELKKLVKEFEDKSTCNNNEEKN